MNRVTIFRNEKGLMFVEEHLSEHPPGNAAQRKKAIKSGWTPHWVAAGRPQVFDIKTFAIENDDIWLTLEPQYAGGVSSIDDDLIPSEVHYVEPEFETEEL